MEHLLEIDAAMRPVRHFQQFAYPAIMLNDIRHLPYVANMEQCGRPQRLEPSNDLLLQDLIEQLQHRALLQSSIRR